MEIDDNDFNELLLGGSSILINIHSKRLDITQISLRMFKEKDKAGYVVEYQNLKFRFYYSYLSDNRVWSFDRLENGRTITSSLLYANPEDAIDVMVEMIQIRLSVLKGN